MGRTGNDGDVASLPVDSDIEIGDRDGPAARPPHLRWRYLGLVFTGGVIGVGLREAVVLVLDLSTTIPWDILGVNLVGAFVLGAFLEGLARTGPDEGLRRVLRLTVGTGMIGGFTTYSALSLATASLLTGGHPLAGALYALVSVAIGPLASWAGIAIVATVHHRRAARA